MDVDIDTSRMVNKSWPTSAECTLISIYRILFRTTTITGGMVNAQTISSVAAISHRRIFSDMEQAERDGGVRYANKAKMKNSILSCSPSCENLRSEITDN